jgi:hypothetical protein
MTTSLEQLTQLEQEGRDIGAVLAHARELQAAVKGKAKDWAVRAQATGMTEVAMAQVLGVDRGNTLRPWLGKPRSDRR